MHARIVITGATLVAFAGIAAAATAQVQWPPPEGTVYALHTQAAGQCPALDWHLVTGPDGTVKGMISWNDMKSMAQVEGTLGTGRSFTLHAVEQGGQGRTATVTGHARPDGWLTADIDGPSVACRNVVIPVWRSAGIKQ